MEKLVTVCDVCLSADHVQRIINPVTQTPTDRCCHHQHQWSHSESREVMDYRGNMPTRTEIDIELRFVKVGVAEVIVAGESMGRITLDEARQVALIQNHGGSATHGPYLVSTSHIELVTPEPYDNVDSFDPDMVVAFLEHDWNDGEFEF